jgi:hypothetical protein
MSPAEEPILFDIVLPPSEYEFDDLIKRELTLAIYHKGVLQAKEVIDVPKNSATLQGFEGDPGSRVDLLLTDCGLEDRQEVDPRTGRLKPGQVETRKTVGDASFVLVPEVWCAAGSLGVRTSVEPPSIVQSFQDEEAMRRIE